MCARVQEAIDRPLTSDLENTKREPHPVLSESRPHTTHDITSTSNFLQGVDQKLLKQTASLARQLDSRGRVLKTPSSRYHCARVVTMLRPMCIGNNIHAMSAGAVDDGYQTEDT